MAFIPIYTHEVSGKFDKTVIEEKLNRHLCRIVFLKENGTIRDMLCTRDLRRVPEEHKPKSPDGKPKNSDKALRVFDVEKRAWRSFKLDNLSTFFYLKHDARN
jgi:hypothetical protein